MQLFRTKLGWLLVSVLWVAAWMVVYENSEGEWAFWVASPGLAYMLGLTLVMIAYAWIINPIRDYRNNRKLRDKNNA